MKEHPFTIGNNCLASYLYKYAGMKFNHPFVSTLAELILETSLISVL